MSEATWKGKHEPEDGRFFGWVRFVEWCHLNDVGDDPDEWKVLWDCWKTAMKATHHEL